MLRKRRYVGLSLLIVLISLSLWALASCGGGGGNSGGTKLTATQQAAASASAAQGAIALSANVAGSVDLASGYIPAGYAPGKGGLQAGTAAIANIDPRLKDVVDKMLVQMRRPAVKTALSKARTFSKVLSDVTSSATIICDSGDIVTGNYVVNDSIITLGTSTTHTLTVTYNACKDNYFANIINGSISATHTFDLSAGSDAATVTITNLTDTTYFDTSYSQPTEIFALNGIFTNDSTGNFSAGTASARGSFTWTMVDAVYGNVVLGFNFGTGGTAISDAWTKSISGGNSTEIHTANGSYGLTVSAPGQSIALGITLTALENKIITYSMSGDTDEWINGSITIGWTPDLSQWGCLNGSYNFTTAMPIHTYGMNYCPIAGTVRVNNAVIRFGVPAGYNVTVTLDSGPSEVFADCYSMGGGMCSY